MADAADPDDDDEDAVGNRTSKQVGLPTLLRDAYHQYMLPRISEVARIGSLIRRYASQLINVYLQDDANLVPNKEGMQTFLNQAQALFVKKSRFRASKRA